MKMYFKEQDMVEVKKSGDLWKVRKQEIADFLEKESNTSKISCIERCVMLVYLPLIEKIDVFDGKGIIILKKPNELTMEISNELLTFLEAKIS